MNRPPDDTRWGEQPTNQSLYVDSYRDALIWYEPSLKKFTATFADKKRRPIYAKAQRDLEKEIEGLDKSIQTPVIVTDYGCEVRKGFLVKQERNGKYRVRLDEKSNSTSVVEKFHVFLWDEKKFQQLQLASEKYEEARREFDKIENKLVRMDDVPEIEKTLSTIEGSPSA